MLSVGSGVSTARGYFVIADISGYTRFVARNDLEHAQGILNELITLLIDKLGAPLQFVELEGDAVFCFAPEAAVPDSEVLIAQMESCYAAFRMRVEQMSHNSNCACSACRAVPSLDLKFVGHFGRCALQTTPRGAQLVGADVTLVHRLLKNTVIESTGVRAYALLSDAFIGQSAYRNADTGSQGDPVETRLRPHVEEVELFGTVSARVVDLAACVERHRALFRESLDHLPVDMEIVTTMNAPARVVWNYITHPALRPRWQSDVLSVRNVPGESGRTDIGWEGHCDHGAYRMVHRIVDWRPFERITMHSLGMGRSVRTPPPCQADFLFEETSRDTCRVTFRVRMRNASWVRRLIFKLALPLIRREWAGNFRRLHEVSTVDLAGVELLPLPGSLNQAMA